jgi:hypothetical protein
MLLAVKFLLTVWLAASTGFCFWLMLVGVRTIYAARSVDRADIWLFMVVITIASLGIFTIGWMWGLDAETSRAQLQQRH